MAVDEGRGQERTEVPPGGLREGESLPEKKDDKIRLKDYLSHQTTHPERHFFVK